MDLLLLKSSQNLNQKFQDVMSEGDSVFSLNSCAAKSEIIPKLKTQRQVVDPGHCFSVFSQP